MKSKRQAVKNTAKNVVTSLYKAHAKMARLARLDEVHQNRLKTWQVTAQGVALPEDDMDIEMLELADDIDL